MTAPILTRWWTVGAGASYLFAYYLQLHHVCQSIINCYASDSRANKIASGLYTKRKQKDAKLAHIAFHGTGRKPIPKLKAIIKGGYIENCPVLSEVVDWAVDIFGPNCSHLKGMVHPLALTPCIHTPDVTEIPHALRTKISPLTLYLNVMYVNEKKLNIYFTSR